MNEGLLKPDLLKMQERLIGTTRKTREHRSWHGVGITTNTNNDQSPWQGLKMACMDPLVPLFSIMTCAQLLGLSFVQFFPT